MMSYNCMAFEAARSTPIAGNGPERSNDSKHNRTLMRDANTNTTIEVPRISEKQMLSVHPSLRTEG